MKQKNSKSSAKRVTTRKPKKKISSADKIANDFAELVDIVAPFMNILKETICLAVIDAVVKGSALIMVTYDEKKGLKVTNVNSSN